MNALFACALSALLLLPADAAPGDEALRKALDAATRELADEEQRIRKEEAAHEAEAAEAKAVVARLADEVAERTRSLAGKTKALEAARAERAAALEARSAALALWSTVRGVAAEARVKLSDLAGALPPSEAREAQRGRLDLARKSLEAPPGAPCEVTPLLDAARSLLAESYSVARFVEPVRNADGALQEMDVLRAGMIFHAYRGRSSERVGEVFAAPAGGAGYRWSESLPEWARAKVRRAFEEPLPPGGALDLPLDVTQRLAPDRHEGGRSLVQTLGAGGMVMIPLCILGIVSVLVVFERVLTLTARCGSSEAAVRAVLDECRAGRWAEAERRAAAGRGTPLRALAAALRERAGGRARMEEAVQETVLHELPALERFLPLLAVFAGVAPMLGLLGTVTGMITTFDMIRLFGSGDPGIMAGGISEALVATATGLVVAIPLLLLHSCFAGRVDRVLADTQRYATTLVSVACGAASRQLAPPEPVHAA
ncbi:MAG: MotA/TolQ/ExbB proton channel family protein [Planctomycetes bacterium]|nr:MotA/TolQ/ExbB proton channel family protein [Planctomycetota bacterium]